MTGESSFGSDAKTALSEEVGAATCLWCEPDKVWQDQSLMTGVKSIEMCRVRVGLGSKHTLLASLGIFLRQTCIIRFIYTYLFFVDEYTLIDIF